MQFRIQMTNDHILTLERDTLGNVIVAIYNDEKNNEPIATAIERGPDISKMAAILGD